MIPKQSMLGYKLINNFKSIYFLYEMCKLNILDILHAIIGKMQYLHI